MRLSMKEKSGVCHRSMQRGNQWRPNREECRRIYGGRENSFPRKNLRLAAHEGTHTVTATTMALEHHKRERRIIYCKDEDKDEDERESFEIIIK
jgi:hypothetical protein